ncbi:TRAM domain-containing protein [Halococcus hamelinensis]|uniref:TRAM domain-containing protein n=1 Tax=Halococcus hamelinensis 100A6 TaxID=1132509 RepID=M0M0V5_9EURY|nr:TRAM domain-containing protein [Halococcus hamelinensis]EMA39028.1 TRAM domain-containing protein [Halococcus hamelinensis 100A6]
MVEISDRLECLFSGSIEEDGDSYRIEIPRNEVENGSIVPEETYRVAVLPTGSTEEENGVRPQSSSGRTNDDSRSPPVENGERRTLTIESVGDQGDGIAKVERGYVVIVPGARPGDEVEVEIQNARDNVAFAEVTGTAQPATDETEPADGTGLADEPDRME